MIVIVSVTVVGGADVVVDEVDNEAKVIVVVAPSERVVVMTEGTTTGPGAVGLGRTTPPEPMVTVTIPEDAYIG